MIKDSSLNISVVYGGLGSGKSGYALSNIDVSNTLKIGLGHWMLDILNLRPGAVKKHIRENESIGLDYKNSTVWNICENIRQCKKPVILFDDWTTIHRYCYLWSLNDISNKCDEIFYELSRNKIIKQATFIAWDAQTFLPFGLYKKRALWNRKLFKVANDITKIEFGIPLKIK